MTDRPGRTAAGRGGATGGRGDVDILSARGSSWAAEPLDHAMVSITRRMAAEAFGAFCLVFAGTGDIVIDEMSGRAITHVGVA